MKCLLYLQLFLMYSVYGASQDIRKMKITDLERVIRESKTPLVVNFWATFCKPCMEELPYFQKMADQYKPGEVSFLLVSLDMKDDYPGKVKAFISRHKVSMPIAWLDETDADYFCPGIDTAWSGAIPATLFINNRAKYRKFTETALTEAELNQEIRMLTAK